MMLLQNYTFTSYTLSSNAEWVVHILATSECYGVAMCIMSLFYHIYINYSKKSVHLIPRWHHSRFKKTRTRNASGLAGKRRQHFSTPRKQWYLCWVGSRKQVRENKENFSLLDIVLGHQNVLVYLDLSAWDHYHWPFLSLQLCSNVANSSPIPAVPGHWNGNPFVGARHLLLVIHTFWWPCCLYKISKAHTWHGGHKSGWANTALKRSLRVYRLENLFQLPDTSSLAKGVKGRISIEYLGESLGWNMGGGVYKDLSEQC